MSDPLHLTGTEIQRLVNEYPKDSIEHQAGVDLVFYQQQELNALEELELAVVEAADILRLQFKVADLKADLKELATHIRTTEGIELVYRLKLKGSL